MNDLWKHLEWDSQKFGMAVARVSPEISPGQLRTVLTDLDRAGIVLAYLNVPHDAAELRSTAEVGGGACFDERTTYAGSTEDILRACGPTTHEFTSWVGPATPDLHALALESGHDSRFKRDPRFSKAAFEVLYREWLTASVERRIAADVFVARNHERETGFVTVAEKAGRSEIGLIAVSPSARGHGLATALVARSARWGLDQGRRVSQVVTQRSNIPACRLYERCGYRVESVEAVFHFWFR